MCGFFGKSLGGLQGCQCNLKGFSKTLRGSQSFLRFAGDTEKVNFLSPGIQLLLKKSKAVCESYGGPLGGAAKLPVRV